MTDLNRVQLIGNIGQDPETRELNNGRSVCNFSLATNVTWKDKQTGEKHKRTEWHRIVIWNQNLISIVNRFCQKGTRVYVEGEIQTRKWQGEDGADRYSTEVVLNFDPAKLILIANTRESQKENKVEDNDRPFGNEESPPSEDFDDDVPW